MTDQQPDLDTIQARAAHLYEYAQQTGEGDTLAGTDVPALVAEVRRLRARVTELEEAGTYARSALAALCYDLEDPGANAFGALHEISRATTGVDAPRDEAAQVLARHDADVIRKAAEVLEDTDRDDDAVNLLYLLADGWEAIGKDEMAASLARDGFGPAEIAEILRRPKPAAEVSHVVADDSDDPEHIDDCPGCEPAVPAARSAAV